MWKSDAVCSSRKRDAECSPRKRHETRPDPSFHQTNDIRVSRGTLRQRKCGQAGDAVATDNVGSCPTTAIPAAPGLAIKYSKHAPVDVQCSRFSGVLNTRRIVDTPCHLLPFAALARDPDCPGRHLPLPDETCADYTGGCSYNNYGPDLDSVVCAGPCDENSCCVYSKCCIPADSGWGVY